MKITDLISGLTEPDFAFELMPLKGQTPGEAISRFEKLLRLNPLFVDIPYHPANYVPAFSLEKGTVQAAERPTTEEISARLISGFQKIPLAHLICRNFTPQQTEEALLQLWEMGVKNLLLIRGDFNHAPGASGFPGHRFAFELTAQVAGLNRGINRLGKPNSVKTDFCIGVAGYPEKHVEAPDFAAGIQHLKIKQEAGAEFIITQLFYDNQKYFSFKQACREAGIRIPIIPAIAPLTSQKKLKQLPVFFQVSLPEALQNELQAAKSEAEIREAGIRWAIKQTNELIEAGEKLIHYFAFSEPGATGIVIREVFKNKSAE